MVNLEINQLGYVYIGKTKPKRPLNSRIIIITINYMCG